MSAQPEGGSVHKKSAIFAEDPVGYFDGSYKKMHSPGRGELEELQMCAILDRFEQQKGRIPILAKLADRQGIQSVQDFDEALPLFFEQAIYKSYPTSLLVKNDYRRLTDWLNKLTSSDLSDVAVDDCKSIDSWLDRLSEETDLDPLTAAAGNGSMYFLPRNRHDWDVQMRASRAGNFQSFDGPLKNEAFEPVHTVWPTYADGHIAQFRIGHYAFEYFSSDRPELCHSAYPGSGSSDLLFLAARLRAAAERGDATRVDVPESLLSRRAELERQQRNMPAHQAHFMEELVEKLRGQRIFSSSTWTFFYDIATRGLAQGKRCEFSPDSVLQTGGGASGKGFADDWEDTIRRFFNIGCLHIAYGMTETAATNWLCEHQHYHIQPWLIPYVLHPETGKPLPRSGKQQGRLALFDIAMTGHWGGIVSGDAVTLSFEWDCPCGRQSPYLLRDIQRFGVEQGGNDKLTCAATPEIQAEALDFLFGK
jgi:hypothetical protein